MILWVNYFISLLKFHKIWVTPPHSYEVAIRLKDNTYLVPAIALDAQEHNKC